jgi:hypothetical protein
MTSTPVEPRRDGIVERLRAARAGYERCVSDVAPDVGLNGSEWSVVDLLDHSMDRDYQDMARRFIEESSPQFVGTYDPAAELRNAAEGVLGSIDDALAIAMSLTSEQMTRVGQRRGQPFAALDALELSVAHFEEHLAQLKDEIRPREGLPPVSA